MVWITGAGFAAEAKDLSLLLSGHTGYQANPASYAMCNGNSSPRVKAVEA
jgi:hypothetical protein